MHNYYEFHNNTTSVIVKLIKNTCILNVFKEYNLHGIYYGMIEISRCVV